VPQTPDWAPDAFSKVFYAFMGDAQRAKHAALQAEQVRLCRGRGV
jgi:hypothetical protein